MALKNKYVVRLSAGQRAPLGPLASTGRNSAATLTRGRILLKADAGAAGPGGSDDRIAEALDTSAATVARVRKRFVRHGPEAAGRTASSTAPRRPGWWRWRAARPPAAAAAGP
jgi:hypothetical protein